jgi:hypothetical protein
MTDCSTYILCQSGGTVENWGGALPFILTQLLMDLKKTELEKIGL